MVYFSENMRCSFSLYQSHQCHHFPVVECPYMHFCHSHMYIMNCHQIKMTEILNNPLIFICVLKGKVRKGSCIPTPGKLPDVGAETSTQASVGESSGCSCLCTSSNHSYFVFVPLKI